MSAKKLYETQLNKEKKQNELNEYTKMSKFAIPNTSSIPIIRKSMDPNMSWADVESSDDDYDDYDDYDYDK